MHYSQVARQQKIKETLSRNCTQLDITLKTKINSQTSSLSFCVHNMTMQLASYSQVIRQKSTTVVSNGAWVAMNASRCWKL